MPGQAKSRSAKKKHSERAQQKKSAKDNAQAAGRKARRHKLPAPTVAPAKPANTRGRPRRSPADAEARRRQILAAALIVFSAHGFEAARLDEIARKAGVAKGTLYLYFPDKQAMFEALVRSAALPVISNIAALTQNSDLPADVLLRQVFAFFRREVLGTERKLILRLVISEGARFPEIAAFYHREIITRVMAAMKNLALRARRDRQLATDGPVAFPQLIAAPLLLSVIWDSLFEKIDPLDVDGLLEAHAALLTKRSKRR